MWSVHKKFHCLKIYFKFLIIVFSIYKDIRDLFRLEKENKQIKDRIIIDIMHLFEYGYIRKTFRFKKHNKVIEDRILRDIRNLSVLEEQEENYYKLLRVSNIWSNY